MGNYTDVYADYTKDFIFEHNKTKTCEVSIHLHDTYEIFMAMSENVLYNIEGFSYELKAGDIIITNEKELHRPIITNNEDYERIFLQFKPYAFAPFFNDDYDALAIFKNRNLGQNNLFPASEVKNMQVDKLFNDIEKLYNESSAKNLVLIKTLIVQMLVKLESIHVNSNEWAESHLQINRRVASIINDLNESFSKPFSLEKLSERHYMDKYYLCHLFKENTGFSLLEYIQSKRIQHAKMLIHQGVNITEASRLSGFEEYSNFYKTFKKLMKISPKDFKEKMS